MINLAHVDIVLAEIAALVAKWNDPYIHLLPSNEIFSKIKREEVVLILQFLAQERAIGFFDPRPSSRPQHGICIPGDFNPKKTLLSSAKTTDFSFKPDTIDIEVVDDFANWYTAYMVKRQQKFEDLSPLNLEKICWLVHDIAEKFALNPGKRITITLDSRSTQQFPLIHERFMDDQVMHEYRQDALKYLKGRYVVVAYGTLPH